MSAKSQTMNHRSTPRVLTAGVVLLAMLLAPAAGAQSENELRRENQRLQAENKQLQKELEAAAARIDQLQEQVKQLQAQLVKARSGGPTPLPELPPEELSIDESVPNASPRALFAALQSSYKEALANETLGADARERRAYMGEVRSWASRANRELRGQVEWRIRVLETQAATRGFEAKVQAVDPKTETKLGEPFWVLIPKNLARRLDRASAAELFVLRGSLLPEVGINERRQTSGPFDNPKLIGPFAEFLFRIDVRSLTPASEDEEAKDEKPGG